MADSGLAHRSACQRRAHQGTQHRARDRHGLALLGSEQTAAGASTCRVDQPVPSPSRFVVPACIRKGLSPAVAGAPDRSHAAAARQAHWARCLTCADKSAICPGLRRVGSDPAVSVRPLHVAG
ncbi:hypothetical protein QFZ67_000356 [Streptomyces sp. V1I1]|nr:hypothetical protein [Streptomyces sp. V1I1]